MIGAITGRHLKLLLGYFDNPEDIFKASAAEISYVCGVEQVTAHKIISLGQEQINKELELAKELGIKIITYGEDGYPHLLKNIYDPPIVLYIKGEMDFLKFRSLAVVGSRRASFYGLANAENLSFELGLKGMAIISGMARGIDTYAHRGALRAGAITVAVLGSGLNSIYPSENIRLSNEISLRGAVISEFPLNTGPLKYNFPRRNRLISGLSAGVLVVEASLNSGALITADFALEQGREVFALPGPINSNTSIGTNQLIKQGAKLVSCANDILEDFPVEDVSACSEAFDKAVQKLGIAQEEALLYNLISSTPILMDDILDRTGMNIGDICRALIGLETKSLIKELPGKQFIKA